MVVSKGEMNVEWVLRARLVDMHLQLLGKEFSDERSQMLAFARAIDSC